MDTRLLGLPLEEAAELLRQEGLEPEICYTRAPRDEREGGHARVIRAEGRVLTCAFFHETPKEPAE